MITPPLAHLIGIIVLHLQREYLSLGRMPSQKTYTPDWVRVSAWSTMAPIITWCRKVRPL
jgi:hypothetical protein